MVGRGRGGRRSTGPAISVRTSAHGQQILIQIYVDMCSLWLRLCHLPVGWPITHITIGQDFSTILFCRSPIPLLLCLFRRLPLLIAQVAAAAAGGYFLIVFSRFLIKAQLDFQFSCNFKAGFLFSHLTRNRFAFDWQAKSRTNGFWEHESGCRRRFYVFYDTPTPTHTHTPSKLQSHSAVG